MIRIVLHIVLLFSITESIVAQDAQYFFIDGAYQRSYINPALNNDKTFSLASGLYWSLGTDGPSLNSILEKNPKGGYILSLGSEIENIKNRVNSYGDASVHTLDASLDLKVFRLSVGHAWKAKGHLQYTKDFAELLTYGNGPYIGKTMNVGPIIDYYNYNELYLGIQKSIGPVSVAARIKNLSGVQAINTVKSKIDVTTQEEHYQLTIDSDYTINNAGSFDYFKLDSITQRIQRLSFDNFLSGNNGWAFDLGVAVELGDLVELSAGVNDIGSITWDKDAKSLISKGVNTYEGIDLVDYIGSDDELFVEDSIRSLLKFEETETSFKTSLPQNYYLGGKLKLSDVWTIGALIRSSSYQAGSRNMIALNATADLKKVRLGIQYTARSEGVTNVGLNGSVHLGPVIGFITLDNVVAAIDPLSATYISTRMGLSLSL